MKQVQYYWPTNFRCHCTKFRYLGYLMPGIFVLLV